MTMKLVINNKGSAPVPLMPDRCLVCDQTDSFRYFDRDKQLFKCHGCGLIFSFPCGHGQYEEMVIRHYTEVDPALRVAQSRQGLYVSFLNKIERRKRKGVALLDIGCGKGYFCELARDRGWQCEGIDIAEPLVEEGRKAFGLDLRCGDITTIDLSNKTFDVITFWNVLEEIEAMPEAVARCSKLLKKSGILYIRTPNSLFHQISAKMVAFITKVGLHRFVARQSFIFHRFSFSNTVIKKLLKKHGFVKITVRNSRPTAGDPYRVGKGIGVIKIVVYGAAQMVYFLTFGHMCLSSSLEVYAEHG
jgi:2-polyprenyl-3-methyl-5-hydroxy-6-metoxy-1,4-benzoquinol methylase